MVKVNDKDESEFINTENTFIKAPDRRVLEL